MTAIIMIGCSASCGKRVPADQIEHVGWQRLAITGRYRCGDCSRALLNVESAVLNDHLPDPLPKDSLGALKKLPEQPELKETVR